MWLLWVHLDIEIYYLRVLLISILISVGLNLLTDLFQRWLSIGRITLDVTFIYTILCLLNSELISIVVLRYQRTVLLFINLLQSLFSCCEVHNSWLWSFFVSLFLLLLLFHNLLTIVLPRLSVWKLKLSEVFRFSYYTKCLCRPLRVHGFVEPVDRFLLVSL